MLFDVQFQKIVIPTPKRVSGNPKAKAEVGGGTLQKPTFSREILDKAGISWIEWLVGVGYFNQQTLHVRGIDIFWNNTIWFSVLFLSVCIKFLTNFAKKLTNEDMKSIDNIDEKFRAVCKKAKTKENRFVSRVMFVMEMC